MKIAKVLTTCLVAAAVVGLSWTAAQAKYYTPLRYDLRFTSPTYIPSGTLRFGPADKPDPYAFGAPQYGNLGITGNLRAGKSFQGHVPYGQVGSQFLGTLPSLGLSKFQRDSIGIGDIGTGVEYGIPEAYIPSSGTVMTAQRAEGRFAVPLPGDRAPYTMPNFSVPVLGLRPMLTDGSLAGERAQGASGGVTTQAGLAIPQSAIAWVDALIAGRVALPSATSDAEAEKEKQLDKRLGLPSEMRDLRIGIGLPRMAEGEGKSPAAETETKPLKEIESALFWLTPGTEKPRQRAPAQSEGPIVTTPAPRKTEPPADEMAPPEPGEPRVKLPPTPQPFRPAATYPVYMERGRAAMKEANYEQAEAFYAAALALEPNQPETFFSRIYAILGGRNYLQASVVLQGQIMRHATWLKMMPDIRSAYSRPETYARIIDNLKIQLETEPDSLNYNFLLGYVYFAGGDAAAARPYLAHAAKLRGGKQGPEKFILTAAEGQTGR